MSTQLPVPAVAYEDHTWTAEPDGTTGRARVAAASGPYRSAIPARIADYTPSLSSAVAADLEEAAAAVAGFDAHAAAALGAEGVIAAPMSAVLLRTESASSSQIEQLTVGARQLALAEIDQATSPNAATVVGNVKAMEAALAWTGPVDQAAILAIHAELLAHQRGWESHAGRYRDRLVWIGRSALGPRGASHVAPQPGLVPEAMADLTGFMTRLDLPILLRVAVAHAQFETIHPFSDGNGRTGRAIIQLMLKSSGLVTQTIAPISAGLLTDTERYFAALTAYRQGDALPIVERLTDATRFAASSGKRLVEALAQALDQDRRRLAGLRPQAVAWRVLPVLVSHPVVNARLLMRQTGLAEASAQRALAQLANAGVVQERTGLRRNRVWQHHGIVRILDDYAAELRRH
jgi:Fic family protein